MTTSPKTGLLAYRQAINTRDFERLTSLFGESVLLELPLVKPHRLFGRSEILAAHHQAFDNLESLEIEFDDVVSSGLVAIAEGKLRYRWKDGEQHSHQLGAVAETRDDELVRISLYCDARNVRLWCDKTVL
jgi:ketosteroid isomerase-like protein